MSIILFGWVRDGVFLQVVRSAILESLLLIFNNSISMVICVIVLGISGAWRV